MKNNTRKILLALILALTLLISMATVSVFAEETDLPEDDGTITIYFENNWLWTEVCCYYWGDGVTLPEWPGLPMTNVGTLNGHELYSYDLPAGVTGVVISGLKDDGSGNLDQTPDIVEGIVDGAAWRMLWADGNHVEAFNYDPSNPEASQPSTPVVPGVDNGVYTVAGVAALCGSEWNVSDTANDMTLNEETGLYELTIPGVPAGTYECKVAANHSWDQSWGTPDNGEFGNYVIELFEEQNVTIKFDPATGTVSHSVAASTGADPNRPAAPTVDFENCGKITIYVGDSANWGTVLVHAWVEGSTDIPYTTWPGLEMEWDSDNMLYYIELPEVCDSVVFNNGQGVQSADLVIPFNGAVYDNVSTAWSDIKDYTPPVPPENTSDDITVYVKDDAGWGDVYIYYWNVAGEDFNPFPGIPMDLGDDGYYYATIPAGQYSVLFSNGGSWEDGSLLQTPDLVIPTNGKVYLSNGNSCLYDDADGNNNDAWYAMGGNSGEEDKPGVEDNPGTEGGNNGNTDNAPVEPKPMNFLQKLAKTLLLFLRSIEGFFKGIFKK